MDTKAKVSIFALRVGLGWLFLYAGLEKVFNPNWSAAGYVQHAQTLSGFYQWLASPALLPFVNLVNEWGLTLLGISLLLGIFVRVSAILGAMLMILYYIPVVTIGMFSVVVFSIPLPLTKSGAVVVDSHIVYALALLVLARLNAGYIWGLERKIFKRHG